MLFKNAQLFRITRDLPELDELIAALDQQRFVPCSGIRPASFGWIPLPGLGEEVLCHEVMGSLLLCAKREDKVVPSSALNDVLMEKIARLEQMEGRPLRAKEKQRLKDDALVELLPRALPKSKQILGYINPQEKLIVIDTASSTEAELFINCLRETLTTLNVTPPQVKSKPSDIFTHWLNTRKLPDDFSFGDACDLLDPEDTSTVSCRRQDLDSREVRIHLEAGKICTRIGLRWHGDLRFTIDKDLGLRQLKLESSDDEMPDEDPIAQLDAAFANMTLEFSRLLPALFSALGGEAQAAE